MTALDILVLLLVGGLGVRGFMRGFVAESISLVAWAAGFMAVRLFQAPVALALTEKVGTSSGAAVLSVAILFALGFGVVRFIGNRLGAASRNSVLGPFDRVLGLGFGAVKGLAGATLAFLIASLLYDTVYGGKAARPSWMAESRTYPLLHATSDALANYVSERRKSGNAPDASGG
jgi:membrane protein required for colicin V production